MKRILMYSHDTVGLGNIRRTLKIANSLIEQDDGATVLILTGSPMLHAFRIKPGIDYVKLPCLDRTTADGYSVKSLSVEFKDIIRLRANLILNTIIDYNPDLILVDKKPFGVNRELAPAFEFLRLQERKTKLALILRDILDCPSHTKRIWNKHHYYDVIDSFYDQVIVLGQSDIFDLTSEYAFPERIKSKVKFCGYLRSKQPDISSKSIKHGFSIKDDLPIVLVTTGSGNDGQRLISTYLRGLLQNSERVNFHSIVLTGPDMCKSDLEEIHTLAEKAPNCHYSEFSNDLIECIYASDLVVSMGGYNTICEILSLKKPAVIVPRVHPVKEQLIRAECMSKRGLLTMIHPQDLSSEILFKTVQEQINQNRNRITRLMQINLDGLPNTRKKVSGLLSDKTTQRDTPSTRFLMA